MVCWIPTPQSATPRICAWIPTSIRVRGITEAFNLLKPDGVLSVAFALPNESLGFKLSHIMQNMPGAGKPLAVRVGYDSHMTTAFIVQKGQDVKVPDAGVFCLGRLRECIGSFRAALSPNPAFRLTTGRFFNMIQRTYPVSYMIALGMVLVLSYLFVRKTIGLSGPERSYMPFFFLGSGFMLVETKAITEWVCISAAPGTS